MRLAWFTPWPPDRHAAARRSQDAVRALLAQGYEIDLFVDPSVVSRPVVDHRLVEVRMAPAGDFEARADTRRYDLVVYQIVSGPAGAFLRPYVTHHPGLAVMHEFQTSAAGWTIEGTDIAAQSRLATVNSVLDGSRLVALTSLDTVRALADASPEAPLTTIAPGIDRPSLDRARTRVDFGIPDGAVVFGTVAEDPHGPEGARRLASVIRAFASVAGRVPEARLLVAGAVDRGALSLPAGLAGHLIVAGAPAADYITRAVTAADVWLDLSWPPAGAISDEWLTAIAAGRPTVIGDLASQATLPMFDPRSWASTRADAARIGVAIDMLDEAHSLRLALYRLAIDATLRSSLGHAAQEYWRATHTVSHMVADFVRAIRVALIQPMPPRAGRPNALHAQA